MKGLSQRMWCTNWHLWHTNSDFYGLRTPTFTPYEPFFLGVGVVFNILTNWCSGLPGELMMSAAGNKHTACLLSLAVCCGLCGSGPCCCRNVLLFWHSLLCHHCTYSAQPPPQQQIWGVVLQHLWRFGENFRAFLDHLWSTFPCTFVSFHELVAKLKHCCNSNRS